MPRFALLVLCLALTLLLPGAPGSRAVPLLRVAHAADNPFRVEAQGADIAAGSRGQIEVLVVVPSGYHVYRDMMEVSATDPGAFKVSKARFPKGVLEDDPADPGNKRESYHEDVRIKVPVTPSASTKPGTYDLELLVAYQGCKANLCYMPQREKVVASIKVLPAAAPAPATSATSAELTLTPEVEAPEPTTHEAASAPSAPEVVAPADSAPTPALSPPTTASPEAAPTKADAVMSAQGGTFDKARDRGVLWLVLFVFGAGFLVSLTPCVLPMIPITIGIIGARASGSRLRAFSLSLTYVLGLSLVYTGLGLVAGLTGSMFGAWMQSPWIVGGVAVFFAAMGLSMFGLFDLTLPSAVSSRLSRPGQGGHLGAFVIGMIGALVAGPCSGPVIASLMVLIGQRGEIALGVGLMGAFSLGMGVLFLVAGSFSSAILRPGAWMVTVKQAFGVLMWLGAIYFVKPWLPLWLTALATALVLLSTAVFGWPATSAEEDEGFAIARTRRLYSVIAGLVGAWLLVGTLMNTGFILPPTTSGSATDQRARGLVWGTNEPAGLDLARREGKPLIVDFTARWCAACHELEAITYTDAAVLEAASGFVLVQIDATDDKDPEVRRLVEKYAVNGLPAVFFLSTDGTLRPELTLRGFEDPDAFLERMKRAREASTK